MWSSCGAQNETDLPFYLKVDVLMDGYRVFLSNHIKLWIKVFSKDNFVNMMLLSNPNVESVETDDDQRFLETGLHILHNPKLVKKKTFTETANGNIQVELLWFKSIAWNVNFELTLCDAEDFFCYVTRPLLLVIKDQIQSESILKSQLLKKDQEIRGFLEMLPENSTLMRCLRTKKYNDEEHRKNHKSVHELFGTDPEEVVCPPQVMQYKRTLPVLKFEDGCDMDTSLNQPTPSTAKMESTNGVSSKTKASVPNIKRTNVKTEWKNCKIEPTAAVKIEPNDGSSELNRIKIESCDGKSEPNVIHGSNHIKIEPKVCKSEPTSATLSGANETQTKDSGQSRPNPESVTDNLDLLVVKHDEAQNTTTRAISPEMRLSQRAQASTPKKRRNNLNY